jgi:hypothetical protein
MTEEEIIKCFPNDYEEHLLKLKLFSGQTWKVRVKGASQITKVYVERITSQYVYLQDHWCGGRTSQGRCRRIEDLEFIERVS